MTAALLLALAAGADAPALSYNPSSGRFEARGLPPAAVAALGDAPARDAAFAVRVTANHKLLGTTGVDGAVVWFRPRFPLEPGLLHAATLTLPGVNLSAEVTPPTPDAPRAAVAAVYPTADVVPENLLKFYLQFTAPVKRGEAYRRVRLLDDAGTAVDLPFLELDEELWDPTGTRLTLFIDPGRIKRGVKPREDVGPVLEAGRKYTLEVDAGWPDVLGRPLLAPVRKAFRAAEPVNEALDPAAWDVAAPAGAAPLVVRFPRPLDRALLERCLTIVDAAGRPVPGTGAVGAGEASWRFAPAAPWAAGEYELRVGAELEDLAGNRPDRPFDADTAAPAGAAPPAGRRFRVGRER